MIPKGTTIMLMCCHLLFAAAHAEDIILADFEGQDFGAWTYTGNCFGTGPVHGPLGDQKDVKGFEGKGFLNTYHGGDGAEGIMTSPEFLIEHDYLNFLLGGGDTGETSIELIIDGKIAWSNTGRNEEELRWRNWDLRKLRGKTARIRIVDTKSGDWGHLIIDSITLSNKPKGPKPIVRKMSISKRYLNFPVKNDATKRGLRIYVDGHFYREFKVELTLRTTPHGPRLHRDPIREIDKLIEKEQNWTDLEIKPGDNPLKGITGELFDIRAQIEPGQAKEVVFKIRGIDIVYNVNDRKLSCLGDQGPLIPIDGKIKLQILVDRASIEIFGNDGLFSLSTCMIPNDSDKTIELFSTGNPAKIKNLSIRKLKSIWE